MSEKDRVDGTSTFAEEFQLCAEAVVGFEALPTMCDGASLALCEAKCAPSQGGVPAIA